MVMLLNNVNLKKKGFPFLAISKGRRLVIKVKRTVQRSKCIEEPALVDLQRSVTIQCVVYEYSMYILLCDREYMVTIACLSAAHAYLTCQILFSVYDIRGTLLML